MEYTKCDGGEPAPYVYAARGGRSKYVNQYNEEVTFERITQIERQTLKEDELIMPMFQGILEREREGLIQQGIEQGIQQSCEEIAAELIREGMGDSAVCRITQLAAERVAEIRRNNSS